MKLWIQLFVIAAVAIGVFGNLPVAQIKECEKETKVTKEELIEDVHSQYLSAGRNVRCFYACLSKKLGVMTANGDIVEEKLLKVPMGEIPEKHRALVQKIKDVCVKKYEDDCETAYRMNKCVHEAQGGSLNK